MGNELCGGRKQYSKDRFCSQQIGLKIITYQKIGIKPKVKSLKVITEIKKS
jgi:hypothetical protein